VHLALIKRADYGLLREAGRFVEAETSDPTFSMHQVLVATAISDIVDGRPLPTLHEFTRSNRPYLRRSAVRALQGIRSPESVVTLMQCLDDTSGDVRYGAMMALATIDHAVLERAPSREIFDRDEAAFIRRLKGWWSTDGHKKFAGRLFR
jgi:hypothetical protein